jgi:hypothetical protein
MLRSGVGANSLSLMAFAAVILIELLLTEGRFTEGKGVYPIRDVSRSRARWACHLDPWIKVAHARCLEASFHIVFVIKNATSASRDALRFPCVIFPSCLARPSARSQPTAE